MTSRYCLEIFACLVFCVSGQCVAQVKLATTNVDGNRVSTRIPPGQTRIEIPNFHARMVSLNGVTDTSDSKIKITPLVDTWEIKLTSPTNDWTKVELVLADPPLITPELLPIESGPDHGFTIPAHCGRVVSEKLRYELQPWKNTVGYWVNQKDYVYFMIRVDQPGRWNVGLLQGCGAGQGGSEAKLSVHGPIRDLGAYAKNQTPLKEGAVDSVEFAVLETGHFQDFRWSHVGQVKVEDSGIYAIKVSAMKIAKNAVMDLRCISLTRVP